MNNNDNVVHVKQARGAGTVLAIVFFWPLLLVWWALLLCAWPIWMLGAGFVAIFDHGDLFKRTWYQPWPSWMSGIR